MIQHNQEVKIKPAQKLPHRRERETAAGGAFRYLCAV